MHRNHWKSLENITKPWKKKIIKIIQKKLRKSEKNHQTVHQINKKIKTFPKIIYDTKFKRIKT